MDAKTAIDPRTNFTPRQNPATPVIEAQTPPNPEPIDLSTITDNDLKREAKESLVMMMRAAKGDLKALGAVRELLDRIEGTPIKRTEASIDMRSVSIEAKAIVAVNERIQQILTRGKTP